MCGNSAFARRGSYDAKDGVVEAEVITERHNPVFGGYEVGIGFSGKCTADSGELEGIVLAGKRSLRLAASLGLMRRA